MAGLGAIERPTLKCTCTHQKASMPVVGLVISGCVLNGSGGSV